MRILSIAIAAITLLGASGLVSAAEPDTWTLPPTTGVLDYQLGGTYDTLPDGTPIDVVARDVTASPLAGAYNICYLNGFQTQPETLDQWLALPVDVLLRDSSGGPVADPDWPDEYILNPSTIEQQEAILIMIAPQIRACAEAGFDAVEFDNLDTFLRFPQLDTDGALMLAHRYIDLAHEHNLAVAQKNTAELTHLKEDMPMLLVDVPVFDFAVAESCAVYDECQLYTEVYGDHVLQIEYPDELAGADMSFADVCTMENRAPLAILRDRNLVGPDDADYVYEACSPRA